MIRCPGQQVGSELLAYFVIRPFQLLQIYGSRRGTLGSHCSGLSGVAASFRYGRSVLNIEREDQLDMILGQEFADRLT